MQIYILAVGERLPSWLETGVNCYIERMPRECKVQVITIAAPKRLKNQTTKQVQDREQKLLIKNTPNNSLRIALDENGETWTTAFLAKKFQHWCQSSPVVSFYIGGPDGFTQDFLQQANFVWAMSSLTIPHMLVRVLLVEQLYRVWTIAQGHPYHRQ